MENGKSVRSSGIFIFALTFHIIHVSFFCLGANLIENTASTNIVRNKIYPNIRWINIKWKGDYNHELD